MENKKAHNIYMILLAIETNLNFLLKDIQVHLKVIGKNIEQKPDTKFRMNVKYLKSFIRSDLKDSVNTLIRATKKILQTK